MSIKKLGLKKNSDASQNEYSSSFPIVITTAKSQKLLDQKKNYKIRVKKSTNRVTMA